MSGCRDTRFGQLAIEPLKCQPGVLFFHAECDCVPVNAMRGALRGLRRATPSQAARVREEARCVWIRSPTAEGNAPPIAAVRSDDIGQIADKTTDLQSRCAWHSCGEARYGLIE